MRLLGLLILFAFTACSTAGADNVQVWKSLRSVQESQLRASLYQDTDGDGVRDFWDQCRETRLGVPVNTLGCPLDRDGDGRPDYQDSEAGVIDAVAATPATDTRIPQQRFRVQVLAGFDYDHSNLVPTVKQELDAFALQVNSDPSVTELELIGHTDSRGSTSYNKSLSLRRARVVQDYLSVRIRSDVLITALGKGEANPLQSNDTDTGRAANRRVEIRTLF